MAKTNTANHSAKNSGIINPLPRGIISTCFPVIAVAERGPVAVTLQPAQAISFLLLSNPSAFFHLSAAAT
jgi:hypothetical protein